MRIIFEKLEPMMEKLSLSLKKKLNSMRVSDKMLEKNLKKVEKKRTFIICQNYS